MKKIIFWIPAFLYMGLIFFLSSFPAPEPARALPIFMDIKAIHVIEYGILACLIFYALDKTTEIPFIWKIIYSVTLTYMYGLTDELHQVFVPQRSAALIDTVANSTGAILSMAAIIFLKNKPKKNCRD